MEVRVVRRPEDDPEPDETGGRARRRLEEFEGLRDRSVEEVPGDDEAEGGDASVESDDVPPQQA